jgi:hypothetical protein
MFFYNSRVVSGVDDRRKGEGRGLDWHKPAPFQGLARDDCHDAVDDDTETV